MNEHGLGSAGAIAPEPVLRGSNQSGMRAWNERLVLSLLRRHIALPKVEIARLTGLSAQTVSVIMRGLEEDGLLVRGAPIRGKVGQPSVPMELAPDGAFFLGLKIGRRSTDLVLCDFLGRVRSRASTIYAYPTPDATISFAAEKIGEALSQLSPEERGRVAGLGIAMPFFLWDWARTLGVPDERMAAWREADIQGALQPLVDFPVFLENDASAACCAEVVFGPSDGPREFLYLYVGYFIGGGVVLNGAKYSGAGNSGAFGPLPVIGPDGTVRQLIDVASLAVLEQQVRAAGGETDGLWAGTEDWQVDEAVLADWVESASNGLAQAIVSACSVIDFGSVKVDGWIPAHVRDDLVAGIERHLDHQNLTGLVRPEILPGSVGPDARALGAASLPLSERFLVDAAV